MKTWYVSQFSITVKKIPETLRFQWRKVCFGTWVWMFLCTAAWPYCLWAYGEASWQEHITGQSPPLIATGKQRERQEGAKLPFNYPLLMVSLAPLGPTSSRFHRFSFVPYAGDQTFTLGPLGYTQGPDCTMWAPPDGLPFQQQLPCDLRGLSCLLLFCPAGLPRAAHPTAPSFHGSHSLRGSLWEWAGMVQITAVCWLLNAPQP